MLSNLHIENIAVIENTDIEFKNGFNILTGETGAGKSIIINSVNMLLGQRTTKDIIRRGETKAHVSAVFTDIDQKVIEIIHNEFGIEIDNDELIISRDIIVDGEKSKNICRINGKIVPINLLKSIGVYLIIIHGQHDNQLLLDKSNHIDFLDNYSKNEKLILKYKNKFNELKQIRKEIKSYKLDKNEKKRRLDILEYEMDEIGCADLKIGEDTELEKLYKNLMNNKEISEAIQSAYTSVYGSDDYNGAYSLLSTARDALKDISDVSEEFKKLSERCSEIYYLLEDFAAKLSDKLPADNSELSIDDIQNRLDLIHKLKIKYGASIEEILTYYNDISNEYEEINVSDDKIKELTHIYNIKMKELSVIATELSNIRCINAEKLSKEITQQLSYLEMGHARFVANINKFTDNGKNVYTSLGIDDVQFLICTNKGEEFKPLDKIASGGELSRVMLAVKSVLAKSDFNCSMIFDEIDTGVSGRVAEKIGLKLNDLSKNSQVICITHLPQIAALSKNHFLIKKTTENDRTFTNVSLLNEEGRINEIARILGGIEIGENTYRAAREMIERHK